MSILGNLERKVMEAFQDRLQVETEFDAESLVFSTIVYFDGKEESVTEYDMTEIVDEIVRRTRL